MQIHTCRLCFRKPGKALSTQRSGMGFLAYGLARYRAVMTMKRDMHVSDLGGGICTCCANGFPFSFTLGNHNFRHVDRLFRHATVPGQFVFRHVAHYGEF